MRNFQDNFETRKRFIRAFSICVTVPLSNLGLRTSLNKIPVLGDILF